MNSLRESNPLRVLHVCGDSKYGGIARIILGLGEVARTDGWQVDVLTTDPVFQQAVRDNGLGLVDLDVIRREIRPLWDLSGLMRLKDFLSRERYRIVHTHTSKGGFVGRLAARLAGVPIIVHTVHGFAFHESSAASERVFYTALEKIAARCCDRVISVSEFHRGWAVELGICSPSEIVAIPNGVPEFSTNSQTAPSDLRQELGIQDGEFFILSSARLAWDKGLDYLIQAAALLPRDQRRYRIAIAGEGAVRPRLESLARELGVADLVTFLGFRRDVGDLLAACDLVALPSLREGLSMAMLEAMSAGKPIVASSIGSHRELRAQAEMAQLVPPADPKSLAAAIVGVSQDPALMARLGDQARVLFERRYTEKRMLNSYRDMYFDLLRSKFPEPAMVQHNDGHLFGAADLVQPNDGGIWHEH